LVIRNFENAENLKSKTFRLISAEEFLMKSGTAFTAALVALTSFPIVPLLAQPAMHPGAPTGSPAAQQPPQQTPAAAMPQNTPSAPPETAAMSPVNGELESKLDSKTAKTGDNIVVRTETTIKTADGTEIPKGSKLMGHVIAVKPSQAGTTSQVALQFDHVELKGGQSLAVHTQIQSIAPAGAAAEQASTSMSARAPTESSAAAGTPGAAASPGSNPSMGGSRASAASPAASSAAGTAASPQDASGTPGKAAPGSDAPAPGTVVAQNGNIAIQTTSIPGVLLANNAPGQQDPRMASASSILLGAKQDIQLEGGTKLVVGVAAAGGTR
jgi:hypothetical protein